MALTLLAARRKRAFGFSRLTVSRRRTSFFALVPGLSLGTHCFDPLCSQAEPNAVKHCVAKLVKSFGR